MAQGYFLKAVVFLITGQASRATDPAVLMEVLSIVRSWLITPPATGELRRHAV